MDLSPNIDAFDPVDLTVVRASAGSYNSSGLFVPGSTANVTVRAVVTPLTGRELQQLPENLRSREAVQLFAKSALLTVDEVAKTPADRFVWNGKTWEVQAVDNWSANANYWRAIAVKQEAA